MSEHIIEVLLEIYATYRVGSNVLPKSGISESAIDCKHPILVLQSREIEIETEVEAETETEKATTHIHTHHYSTHTDLILSLTFLASATLVLKPVVLVYSIILEMSDVEGVGCLEQSSSSSPSRHCSPPHSTPILSKMRDARDGDLLLLLDDFLLLLLLLLHDLVLCSSSSSFFSFSLCCWSLKAFETISSMEVLSSLVHSAPREGRSLRATSSGDSKTWSSRDDMLDGTKLCVGLRIEYAGRSLKELYSESLGLSKSNTSDEPILGMVTREGIICGVEKYDSLLDMDNKLVLFLVMFFVCDVDELKDAAEGSRSVLLRLLEPLLLEHAPPAPPPPLALLSNHSLTDVLGLWVGRTGGLVGAEEE